MTAHSSIADLLEHAMQKYSDRPAYTCAGHTLSFAELEQKSRQLGAWLRNSADLSEGDCVAIQLPNLNLYPVAAYAVLRAGLVLTNINPLYTPREMQHQLTDSGAKAIIILSDLLPLLDKVVDSTGIKTVITVEPGDLIAPPKAEARQGHNRLYDILSTDSEVQMPTRRSDDIQATALLQYTGATTGVAKGACLSHFSILSNVEQVNASLDSVCRPGEDIFVCPLPLYHMYALMINMILLTSMGCLNVLIPNPRDLDAFVKQIEGVPFTGMSGINTLFVGLCNHPGFRALDFSHLRLTMSGGTALIPEVAKLWKDTTGGTITEGYGLTEASPVLTLNEPGNEEVGSIGKALVDTIIEIRDADGNTLPVGEVGELVAKGPQLMKGYWNRPEATREAFTSDGFLRTGDVALLQENGNYRIVDRIKDLIIVSGFNVYPTEIESVLCMHSSVLEAAVIGKPSEKTGEEVVAYVTLAGQSNEEALLDHCRQHLTSYKLPKKIVIKDELPKSTVGKILRRELRDEKSA